MKLSVRARFILYLLAVHAAAAGIVVLLLHQQQAWAWLLLLEAVLIVSFATGAVLVRRLFRALDFVGESAQFLDDGEYTTRFVDVGQPEVDRLIAVYNRMIDHLRRERQRAEEQHYFLSRILDVSPAGVLVLDFDGKVDVVNPAAARLLQVEPHGVRGRSPREIRVPLLEQASELRPGEARVLPLPGGRRVRALCGAFVDRGFPRHFFLLEELTEELRQSEKAAYEKLIRMMSHEVNNSVGASGSLLQSSLAYAGQLAPADRADFERALQIAIDRMGQLNAFMRSFAEVVRLPQPVRQDTDLREVLEGIERLTRAQREVRRIQWVWQAVPVPAIRLDRVQIEQALINIVKNAIEAIDADGSITVALTAEARAVRVAVEDSGPGIPEHVRNQLFTPFFTTKPGGQGIGLTMVQEILQNHGAEYELDSRPGGPTRFTVLLPLAAD